MGVYVKERYDLRNCRIDEQESNQPPVRRPIRLQFVRTLRQKWHCLPTVPGHRIQTPISLESYGLTVRRPGRVIRVERREGELDSLSPVSAFAPKGTILLVAVSNPLGIARETQVPGRNSAQVGHKHL